MAMTNPLLDRATFGQLVIHVGRYWRRAADQALTDYGLSQATALPLLALFRLGDHQRPGAVAEELGIEGPSLVRIIDHLIADELITRRENPSDRRAKILSLTERGLARVGEIEAVVARMRAEMLSSIDPGDLRTTVAVLRQVEQTLLGSCKAK
jgi:MarR family transcriptional regulator for hemolysin